MLEFVPKVDAPRTHVEKAMVIGCVDGRTSLAHAKLIEFLCNRCAFTHDTIGGPSCVTNEDEPHWRENAIAHAVGCYVKVKAFQSIWVVAHTAVCEGCIQDFDGVSLDDEIAAKLDHGWAFGRYLQQAFTQAALPPPEIKPLVYVIETGELVGPGRSLAA